MARSSGCTCRAALPPPGPELTLKANGGFKAVFSKLFSAPQIDVAALRGAACSCAPSLWNKRDHLRQLAVSPMPHLPTTAAAELGVPTFYCGTRDALRVSGLRAGLRSIGPILSAPAAEVHPVGVEVVVQVLYRSVPLHEAFAVAQLCGGEGRGVRAARGRGWRGREPGAAVPAKTWGRKREMKRCCCSWDGGPPGPSLPAGTDRRSPPR